MGHTPAYLEPYQRAAARHGAGFQTLLWASQHTQRLRFDAILGTVELAGRTILDVGCGRADFLDHLVARGVPWGRYVGIEGVPELAAAARVNAARLRDAVIVEADFIADPSHLDAGAGVILFSGSLNTMDGQTFYDTLRRAHAAAGEWLVFNFLASPSIAAADYLTWHRADAVALFARSLGSPVTRRDDYIDGDCTIAIGKAAV